MTAASWEVIARAGMYIARLGATEVTGSVASWLLRSIERDLIDDATVLLAASVPFFPARSASSKRWPRQDDDAKQAALAI
jgi:hypothetical protein